VIHRDLQNDNILYVRSESGGTSRYQIKITDFGSTAATTRDED
jgi:serine/threonine protein kinase